jgi:regulator of cell morphogenesis and NO signaling
MSTRPIPSGKADDSDGTAWETRDPEAIIAFILDHFHAPLRRDLPNLLRHARLIEGEYGASALCPRGLGDHLEQVHLAVKSHLAKEEKILFPLICAGRGGRGSMAFMPIKVMMAEHEDHVAGLRRTRLLTHDFSLPANASPAWRSLYADLQVLEADLNQHIHLEDNVLFTRVMVGEHTPSL